MTTDTHKPKLLLAGTQMATGGAQKVLLVMADWFSRHGYDVDAVFFYDREGLEQRWKETSDFPITNLNAWQKGGSSLKKGLQLLGGLRRFYRIARPGGPGWRGPGWSRRGKSRRGHRAAADWR